MGVTGRYLGVVPKTQLLLRFQAQPGYASASPQLFPSDERLFDDQRGLQSPPHPLICHPKMAVGYARIRIKRPICIRI